MTIVLLHLGKFQVGMYIKYPKVHRILQVNIVNGL